MSRVLTDEEAERSLSPGSPISVEDLKDPEIMARIARWQAYPDGGGFVANQAKLEALLGRKLPDELFQFQPWGYRVVVTRDEPLRKIGGIHLPDSSLVPPARGTVVSVGHQVGRNFNAATNICPLPASQLLGATVLFGNYAGQSLKIDPRDDDYLTYNVILTEGEIWGLVGELPKESLL